MAALAGEDRHILLRTVLAEGHSCRTRRQEVVEGGRTGRIPGRTLVAGSLAEADSPVDSPEVDSRLAEGRVDSWVALGCSTRLAEVEDSCLVEVDNCRDLVVADCLSTLSAAGI